MDEARKPCCAGTPRTPGSTRSRARRFKAAATRSRSSRRARARRPDARDVSRATRRHADLRHPGRLLRAADADVRAAIAAAAHRRRRRSSASPGAGRSTRGADRVVAAVRGVVRRRSRARATSPTRCAASSRTAGAAAGSCASRRGSGGARRRRTRSQRRRAAAASRLAHRAPRARASGATTSTIELARDAPRADGARSAQSTPDYATVRVGRRLRARDARACIVGRIASSTACVSSVDASRRRLYCVQSGPQDAPAVRARRSTGFDPNRPLPIESDRVHARSSASRAGSSAVVEASVAGPGASALRRRRARCRAPSTASSRRPAGATEADLRGWRERRRPAGDRGPLPVVIRELRDAAALRTAVAARRPSRQSRRLLAGGADGLSPLSRARLHRRARGRSRRRSSTRRRKRRGLRALEQVDEVALVAVPDIHIQPRARRRLAAAAGLRARPLSAAAAASLQPVPRRQPSATCRRASPPTRSSAVQAALVEQCERLRDRFAMLDPPFDDVRDADARHRADCGPGGGGSTRRFAALYAPVAAASRPARGRRRPALRARSRRRGHVCGLSRRRPTCATGVHMAPANAPLRWVQDADPAARRRAARRAQP